MNRLKQWKTYPFGLFLWLEWVCWGAAFFGEVPDEFLGQPIDFSNESLFRLIIPLSSLVALSLTGLVFPKDNLVLKWLYTFWQFGLLWLAFWPNYDFLMPHLIIVMRSCLIFEKHQRLVAAILTIFVQITLYALYASSPQSTQVGAGVGLSRAPLIASNLFLSGLCTAVVFLLITTLLREYESRQKLALAHRKLNEYALLVEDRATLHERNRIAREIHDSVGHALTAQTIQLNNVIAFWQSEPAKAYQFLTDAQQSLTATLQDIRHSVSMLRADPLQGKSLATAIALLVQDFSCYTKIVPQYTSAVPHPLSEEVKTTIYRVVQEALTNVAKHSAATQVTVDLQTLPAYLQLIVKDDGKGFDPEQTSAGFGLQGIRERVTALGGSLEISSGWGCGCTLVVKISC
ncbi:MAG: sensor histidine kinase [Cyanothece sp. SIO1E1]|nr:sensor histidine kinase [Cyanothece sp. SIO1E1]